MRLTDKKYWNTSYQDIQFIDSDQGAVIEFLKNNLEIVSGKSSIEVGSFPGNFIPVIGRKGYLVNGIDYNERNATDLPNWLMQQNLEVGKFWTADFLDFIKNPPQQYDLVCSFGFIEHFKNFEEIIVSHAKLVAPGGKLIITTPNFRGLLQRIPRMIFDKKNLNKHFLPSMNPRVWKSQLESMGYEVIYSGCFGGYLFWVDDKVNRGKLETYSIKIFSSLIFNFGKLLRRLNIESRIFSAFCGIVAIRKQKE